MELIPVCKLWKLSFYLCPNVSYSWRKNSSWCTCLQCCSPVLSEIHLGPFNGFQFLLQKSNKFLEGQVLFYNCQAQMMILATRELGLISVAHTWTCNRISYASSFWHSDGTGKCNIVQWEIWNILNSQLFEAEYLKICWMFIFRELNSALGPLRFH